jgi:hypothetical protein
MHDGLTMSALLTGQRESNGFGLYGHEARTAYGWRYTRAPHAWPKIVDEAVLATANALGWDWHTMHAFLDSRDGRHCGDDLSRFNTDKSQPAQVQATIEKYMRRFAAEGGAK